MIHIWKELMKLFLKHSYMINVWCHSHECKPSAEIQHINNTMYCIWAGSVCSVCFRLYAEMKFCIRLKEDGPIHVLQNAFDDHVRNPVLQFNFWMKEHHFTALQWKHWMKWSIKERCTVCRKHHRNGFIKLHKLPIERNVTTRRKVLSIVLIAKGPDVDEYIACNMDEGRESFTSRTNRKHGTLAVNGYH